MRKMNKKGDVFITLWMVSFLLILGVIAVTFYLQTTRANQEVSLGYYQIKIMNLTSEGDKINYYLDECLEQSFDDSIKDLAGNGGFYSTEGKVENGYILWQWGEKCYPSKEEFYLQLSEFLDDNMNKYWELNKEYFDIYWGDLDYAYDFNDENGLKIKGDNVEFTLNNSFDGNFINYTFNATLLLKRKNNFDMFFDALNEIENVAGFCGDDLECWNSDLDSDHVQFNKDGSVYKFDIKVEIEDRFGDLEEIIFKGAIDFSEYNPLLGDEFIC